MFIDLSEAKTNPQLGALNVVGARLSYLDKGDRFDLRSRRFVPAERKANGQRLDPSSPTYRPEYLNEPFYVDMLGDGALANAMGFLIDSSQQEIKGLGFDPRAQASDPLADLGFQFRLYKGQGSLGWYADAAGADEYSVSSLYLDITPVKMSRPFFTPWTGR